MRERLDCRGFVIADVKNGIELGNLQDVVDFIVEVEKLQFSILPAHGGKGAHELAKPGTVDVADIAHIEQEFLLAAIQQIGNYVPQCSAFFAQNNAAADIHDNDIAGVSSAGCHVHCNPPLKMSMVTQKPAIVLCNLRRFWGHAWRAGSGV